MPSRDDGPRPSMHFRHAPAIWEQFPSLVPGALVVEGIRPDVEVPGLLEPWYQRAHERLSQGAETELAEVSAWRRAYAQMGLKPTQYRSAAEALLRRFRREGALPRLHPLVDIGNAVSLAFALPVAIFDLAAVDSHLEVRHARGDEAHIGFDGKIENPDQGEVIFADADHHAHARRWTFRQSRRSTVTSETRRALVVVEGLHATAAVDVPALLETLAASISRVGGVTREHAILSAATPQLDFTSDPSP